MSEVHGSSSYGYPASSFGGTNYGGGGVSAANHEYDNRAASPNYYGQGGERGQGAEYGGHGYGYDAVPTTEERAELGAQHHRNGSGYSDGGGGGGPDNSAAAAATAAIASSSSAARSPDYQYQYQQQPISPVESVAGRFELDTGAGTGIGAGGDDHPDRHHDDGSHYVPGPDATARDRDASAGHGGGGLGQGGGHQRPLPLATPASEYSELASPNSVSEIHDRETW